MVTSKEIIDKWKVVRKGQLLLFEDYDDLLLQTPFIVTDDSNFDTMVLIHFWMNVYKPSANTIKQDVYRTWVNGLYKYFKYAYPRTGYFTETNQSEVSFAAIRKDDLKPQLEELSLWIPFIKPLNNKHSVCKIIDIFEHTLSYNGSYSLNICDNQYKIIRNNSVKAEFDSLESVVSYIKNNLWYE